MKTALINDRPKLGSNAAEEANVALEGAAHRGYHETGVVFELKNYKETNQTSWSDAFERYALQEKNLDVFSNMLLVDATTEENTIQEIITVHTHDLTEYKFSADLYADATGDGWLGYYAGAFYRIGRAARFQHGESFASETADGNTMSGCATGIDPQRKGETVCGYFADKTEHAVEFKAPSWAFQLPGGDSLGRIPDRLDRGAWWLEMSNDYDDLFESEFARDSMLRMAVGYFDWLKNSWSDREKASNYTLRHLGTYHARRKTRRLIGDSILTENDYVENQSYFDSVGYRGWKIDVHHVDGIFSGNEGKFTVNQKIPITPIPFGALYSKNIRNLLMTGRCISTTHIGLGPARVQLTAGILGQAIATAAYLCKKHHVIPREVRSIYIDELQQLLIKDGVFIPGVFHHDANDLAVKSIISATSHAPNGDPRNVVNGKTRKTDGEDYAWISNVPLPQSITLTFDAPKRVRQVRITFDMPFEKYKYGYMEQPIPEELVTDFTLSLLINDRWIDAKTVTDNIQRLVVVDIDPTIVEGVKLTVTKTVGTPNAIIPEIRIY